MIKWLISFQEGKKKKVKMFMCKAIFVLLPSILTHLTLYAAYSYTYPGNLVMKAIYNMK